MVCGCALFKLRKLVERLARRESACDGPNRQAHGGFTELLTGNQEKQPKGRWKRDATGKKTRGNSGWLFLFDVLIRRRPRSRRRPRQGRRRKGCRMRVREKSRNGEESGWGEFISAGRLRGENTLPINDRDVGIVFPFMSRRAPKKWRRSPQGRGTSAPPVAQAAAHGGSRHTR